eukprot:TRINITY_DN10524_c0_g1_i1.p1 TRINITY_DN10524_c0_g1~~TRINITY_DN10524_c0_g1_i1.p1  ORF type:complete len:291 (-),score=62.63 TRINITY_DN10524_c0_g1_i1:105-905(-)
MAPRPQRLRGASSAAAAFLAVASATLVGAAVLRGSEPPLPQAVALAGANRSSGAAPCACVASDPTWKRPERTTPRCIFIDLGAADGNSFQSFLSDNYGPVGNCPSNTYEAFLVEANPGFTNALNAVGTQHVGKVHPMGAHAAYMCEGKTSFNIDPDPTHNHWASSMGRQMQGQTMVTVPTVNLMRLIHENTIPGDWVMVKMDIEGAEWDVLPCLANSPDASLVDRLYVEVHPREWSSTGTTQAMFDQAKAALKAKGVDIPDYFSKT